MAVEVKYDGLYVNGKRIPVYSGTVHYWRLERNLWPELLDKVKGMGFQMLETYIPWSVHEIEQGKFDFGQINPNKDLDAFLSLGEKKGFYLLVRPGPHINAELTYFGYPRRVLLDPEIQARTADNTPAILPVPPKHFPIPSYASEKFYSEVGIWLDAVCPIIAGHIYPRGKIIAIQSDNEMSFFFRTSPYDLDYSPGAINLYHCFLNDKYGHINNLNQTYGTNYASFKEISAPRSFDARHKENLPFYLDWAEFKEYYIIYGLMRIASMFRKRGIESIPIYHNYPTAYPKPPFNLIETEKVLNIQGIDIYPHKEDYEFIKLGAEYTSVTSRMPFIPEFGSGVWFWYKSLLPEDEIFTTLTVFMHGIKAINYYMIVERERWMGSPVTRDNRIRESYYKFYQRLNEMLTEIDFASLRKKSDFLLLCNWDYERLEYISQIVSLPLQMFLRMFTELPPTGFPSDEKLGFEDVIPREYSRWWGTIYRSLCKSGYSFSLSDTQLPLEKLQEFPVVIVPTFEFMNVASQRKLMDYTEKGGTLVIGPRIPLWDEKMQKNLVLGEGIKVSRDLLESAVCDLGFKIRQAYILGAHSFVSAEGKTVAGFLEKGKGKIILLGFMFSEELEPRVVELLDRIAHSAGIKREIWCEDSELDLTYHESDQRRVIFLANPTAKTKQTRLKSIFSLKLVDAWTRVAVNSGAISLSPYTVKVLEAAK